MSRRLAGIAAMAALAAAGCFSLKPMPVLPPGSPNVTDGKASTAALGSIQVSSPQLGDLTVVPTDCSSGARQYFLGGDLVDSKAGVAVRLAVDPIGSPAIRVFSQSAPFDKSVSFRREECSVFHFSINSTGWRVNLVDDYQITINVDCVRGNESVRGTASSTHCY